MQLSRREAVDEFLHFVTEFGDDEARTIAEGALNRAIESIWQEHHWRDFQSPAPLELTLAPPQRSYPLPDFYGRPGLGSVRNLTTGDELRLIDNEEADEFYPERGTSLESASIPRHILLGGIVGVQRQPAVTGEECQVVSTSGLDTGVRVTVVGQDENGNEHRAQVTLAGTAPVSVGTWSYIDEIGKAYPAGTEPTTPGTSSEGTVSLKIASTGTVLQQLFPEESAREHRVVTFLPKPSVAHVIAFPIMRRPPRLRYDGDPLPADWWNAIFEELQISWQVNKGTIAIDSGVPRPQLLKLIGLDNANKPRPTIRRFGR